MIEHTLHSIAFPVLNEDQIARVANCSAGVLKCYRDGESLIAVVDRELQFLIVNSSEIEIVDYWRDKPKTITIHGKGEFTGDISHLTGAPALLSALSRSYCEVFEISTKGR